MTKLTLFIYLYKVCKNKMSMIWKLVLVDDFSNYEAQLKSICNSFRSLNIIYLRNEKNIGLARSRNKGLENSTGDYISFLDSDDEYLPDKLKKQYEYLKKGKFDIVYCKELVKSENYLFERDCNRNFDLEILIKDQYINLNTLLISKKILNKYKISFNNDELSRYGEDLEFLIELRKNTNNIYFIDEFLTISRRRSNNHRNYKMIWKEFEKLEKLFSDYLYDKDLVEYKKIIKQKITVVTLKKNIAYILSNNKKKFINNFSKIFKFQSLKIKILLILLFFLPSKLTYFIFLKIYLPLKILLSIKNINLNELS